MTKNVNWAHYYPVLQEHEFRCSHTGKCEMDKDFLDLLYALRLELDEPLIITSGYRDETHPAEAKKSSPGFHTKGMAVDIACWSDKAWRIVRIAFKLGFTGIGVSQRPGSNVRFIHLDTRKSPAQPRLYSY